jgi:glutamine synthetase
VRELELRGKINVKSQQIIEKLRESAHQKVKVAVTDMDGILRGKYMHRDKFFSASESGFGFCSVVFGWDANDVCYDNTSFTGWHTGYPDTPVKIDLSTFREIPWEDQLPFFLGEFEESSGKPLPICPRQLLKKVLRKANEAGFKPQAGMEFEWFNFKETPQSLAEKNYSKLEPITPGMFGYSLLRSSLNQPFFTALMDEMRLFGIPIEGLHTETGPGVLEAAILYSDALEAADRAVLFKTSTKQIGYRFGIVPSFMAKWNSQLPGCSGHIHLSLWNSSNNQNLFHEAQDRHKMSALFKSFLAGQLQCLPEILPFFAPTVNSYKRLVEGYWAPTRATWGVDNRTTAFRVIPAGSKSTRVEVRVPGADVNPYLAIAAALASGLYGIEKNLELKDPPINGNAYENSKAVKLPRTLQEATQKLSESQIARTLFGEEFVDHFVNSRIWEWKQFQDSVTHWELKRYFEII